MARSDDTLIADAVTSWQRQLLDLSNANPLVSISRSPVTDGAIAADPRALPRATARSLRISTASPTAFFQRLAIDTRSLPVELSESTKAGALHFAAESAGQVERKLTTMRRLASAALAEQGVQILFATFGLLRWRDPQVDDGWRFAPLVLVPVTLERPPASGATRLVPTGDGPLANHTIRARLAALHVRLPEPDDVADLAQVLADTRDAVADLPGWDVLDVAEVGLFQYHKLPMHESLGRNVHRVRDHALLRALAGVGEMRGLRPGELPAVTELDHAIPAAATFPLLDADASQRRAIAAAVAGLERPPGEGSIVIQGPPGTGKSQTIANIVAEALARGKSVLFVSEKLAALQVVARRLREAGIGDQVIELHSHHANSADLLAQLQRSLNGLAAVGPQSADADAVRLDERIAALADDTALLSARHEPLGRSLYEAIGALAAIDPAARAHWLVTPLPPSTTLTWERLEEAVVIVDRIAALGVTHEAVDDHPWRHLSVTSLSLEQRHDIAARLPTVAPAIRSVLAAAAIFSRALGLPDPRSTHDLDRLAALASASTHRPPTLPEWFAPGVLDQLRDIVARQRAAHSERGALVAQVGVDVDPASSSLDPDVIERALFHPMLRQTLAADAESAIFLVVTRGADVAARAAALVEAATATADAAGALALAAGFPAPASIVDGDRLERFIAIAATGPAASPRWLTRGAIHEVREAIDEAAERSAEHRTLLAAIAAAGYTPKLVAAASPELIARRQKSGPFRRLSGRQRADDALLAACRRPGARPTPEATRSALEQARQASGIDAWFANQGSALAARIGLPVALDTDWDALLQRLDPIEEALRIAVAIPIRSPSVTSSPPCPRRLSSPPTIVTAPPAHDSPPPAPTRRPSSRGRSRAELRSPIPTTSSSPTSSRRPARSPR